MKKLETLTKEQEDLLITVRNEWINRFNNTKRINQKQFEKGIKWLYEDLLKKKNPKILYCESWLETLLTIHVLQNYKGANVRDNVCANVWANVWANVRDNVCANVWANVWDNVWANVWANVWDNVRDNVCANVRDNVEDNVWDNVWANVEANVWDNVEDNVETELQKIFSNYSNYLSSGSNFGWSSFYDYFEKIGILKNDNFKKYKSLIQAGAFEVYEYENFVFAIQPPTKILRNEQGQMNSINEMAFEWSDGYGFYYVNGLNLTEKLFNKLKSNNYTTTDFAQEVNEEIKSAVISFIQQKDGEEGVYRFFAKDLKEVDIFIDKKENKYLEGTTKGMNIGVYTLFKGVINNTEVAYVRCYCPSTDRMFFLGVEPSNTNAQDSIASLYQVPKLLKNNIVTISRQGEIFSTTFDENTTNKLKNNEFSLDELKDYVSLSGEEYFSKMTYEY